MAKVRRTVGSGEREPLIVEIPVGDYSENGYQSRLRVHDQLHITSMTKKQRIGLAMLYCGLHADGTIINGRPVASQGDAIRWLLDVVADGCGVS